MKLDDHGLRYATVEPSSITLFRGGRRVVAWQDELQVREEIARIDRADVDGYGMLLADLGKLGETLNVSFFEEPPPFGEIASRLRSVDEQRLFAQVMFGSATDLVTQYLHSEEMRASVGSIPVIGTMLGPSDPGSAYFIAHRAIYRGAKRDNSTEATSAPWTKLVPRGGMGAIAQAMEHSVRAAGVTIRLGTPVGLITCEDGRTHGVVLADGEEFEAPVVVSNANPLTTLLGLTPRDALTADFRARLENVEMKGTMDKVYLALDGEPRFACARDEAENQAFLRAGFRTAPFLDEIDRGAERVRAGEWHEEPTIYGVLCSAVDPSFAPPGKHLLSLSIGGSPYALGGEGWSARRAEWIEHVVETLTEHIPNLPDIIIDTRARTLPDLEAEFGLLGGHSSHGDMTAERLFGWGPVPGHRDSRTPVQGLYLCSVGTWPANFCSGVPGHNAAKQVIGDLMVGPQTASERKGDADHVEFVDLLEVGPS
jgi:phytoene dehydrogenase-like protein